MNGRATAKLRAIDNAANSRPDRSSRRARSARSCAGPRIQREGVILLVVLGLLTLFALMTMTFILVAAQARRTAIASSQAEQHGDAPQDLLEEAAKQILRAPTTPSPS